jgi:hypothetical protein
MKKQTLVIHPQDPTTDFLTAIYDGRGFTELRTDFYPPKIKKLIEEHERIILLGHGFHHGLLNYYQTIIDESYVSLLRDKELVGIWCYAKSFFERHHLTGFYTDMFISETQEAILMGVEATEKDIEVSNQAFAKAVRRNLFHPECFERIFKEYQKINTSVGLYNQVRLSYRSQNGLIQGNEDKYLDQGNSTIMDLLSNLLGQNPELITQFLK